MGKGVLSWDGQSGADKQLLLISTNGGAIGQTKTNL